jgi:hypothetical protein
MHRTAGNIDPHYYLVRLLAHEIGHDLWARHFVHVPALRNNDVPASSNRRPLNWAIGYTLMAGAGGGMDCGGLSTISVYERLLLGWIDCIELTGTTPNVVLKDLYTSSQCAIIPENRSPAGQGMIILSYHRRLGPFDRELTGGVNQQYELGQLRTEGLLATLVRNGSFEVLPADNTLDLSARDAAYQGDLFGDGPYVQLTPWTRPNINGFTLYPSNFLPRWHAIDDLRGDGDQGIAFDYIEDFRLDTVIRSDSWMTHESANQAFGTGLRITNRATLSLAAAIRTSGRVTVESGSTLIVEELGLLSLDERSVLDVRPGGTLDIRGVVEIAGIVITYPGSHVLAPRSARILSKHRQTER